MVSGRVAQLALHLQDLAAGRSLAALQFPQRHRLGEPLLLRLLRLAQRGVAALQQHPLAVLGLLRQLQPRALEVGLFLQIPLLRAPCQQPRRQVIDAPRVEPRARLPLDLSGCPAGFCSRRTISSRVAPSASLCSSVDSASSGAPLATSIPSRAGRAMTTPEKRGEHPQHALLRHQPAVDPRLAGVLAEDQQRHHGNGGRQRNGGEDELRYCRRQQYRAQPACLVLGKNLGPEQQLAARRRCGPRLNRHG